MLLGRAAMQKIGMVVSTIYEAVKFHTTQGIRTVFSTHESNKIGEGVKKINETSPTNTKGVLSCTDVEEKIIINSKYPEQTVTIEKQLPKHFKERLRNLLRTNADVFAWTHADMTGIPRTITVNGKPSNTEHKLNEYSHIKSIKQKRRNLGPYRSTAARKEVEDLTRVGILREAAHQTWSLPFFKVLKSCTDKKNIQWTQESAALQEMKKFVETLPTLTTPIHEEVLMMYRKHKRSFIREKGRRTGSHLLCKQSPTGSRAQLPCTNTSVGTRNEKAAKIFSSTYSSDPNQLSYQTGTHETQKVRVKEVERKMDTKLEETKPSYEWKLYTNGGSSSDGSGAGLMLIDPKGKEYTYALRFEFETTNKEAEYEALLAGLRIAQEMEIVNLAIFVDSQLLVNQIKGIYAAKQPVIREYLQRTKETLRRFMSYTIEHIRRNQNKKANALSKLASMTFKHLTKEVLVEVLTRRSIEEKEVLQVEPKKRKAG
ncbi:reverse transcriptase domain-containing protein [Tanacetum coccineum]|uniref:Reverse transcriptase domain-containing protein n=1 Tax=Tanacetum coccineum TaxID=301880 RepID=A0ABQ5IZR0_9ASTR